MFRKVSAILLVALLLLSAAACGSSGTASTPPAPTGGSQAASTAPPSKPAEKIILKAGNVIDVEHPYSQAILKFGEIVAEKTEGRIEVQLFHSSQLGNETDLIEGLKMGSVELCAISSAPAANFVPNIAVFDMPYLFKSRQQAYNVMDGELGVFFFGELLKEGVRGLGWWENGFRNVTNSKRPITKPEDLQGIKIRVMENPIPIATFNACGANATAMAWGEVFTALQQKTIDAQENPLSVIYLQRLYEVQKYLSLTEHFYAPALFLMSDQIYQKLSPEDQKIISEAAAEATAFERKVAEQQASDFVQKCKDSGMEVNTVEKEPFMKAMSVVYAQYEDQFGEMIRKIQATPE